MPDKILSIFIDESGDFGAFQNYSPYYIVGLVFHDQSIDISSDIDRFYSHLKEIGYEKHFVHTGPLIRREKEYENELVETRKHLFNSLYNFTRKLSIKYTYISIKKIVDSDSISETISNELFNELNKYNNFIQQYDKIIIYYDKGQRFLNSIIQNIFHELYTNCEFRIIKPAQYMLFQSTDLICTMALLHNKYKIKAFTKSELLFFDNYSSFKKNYLKQLLKKHI